MIRKLLSELYLAFATDVHHIKCALALVLMIAIYAFFLGVAVERFIIGG